MHSRAVQWVATDFHMQSGALDKLSQPVRFLDSFIMPKSRTRAMQGVPDDAMQGTTTLTLVDICRGGALNHVNQKYVVSDFFLKKTGW